MKLYAKVSSERASKGQGGNKYLHVDFLDELKRIVVRIEYMPSSTGSPYLVITDGTGPTTKTIHFPLYILKEKGKKQKGERCEICGAPRSPECEYHEFIPE